MTRRTMSWHLWPARNWPFDASEEATFVADLEDLAGDAPLPRAERAGITAVVNALRCGASVAEMLTFLPGTSAEVLLAAYRHVEERRILATDAWDAIVADPRPATIRQHAQAAARIAPVPTFYLNGLIDYVAEDRIPEAVARQARNIADVRAKATEIERRLRMLPMRDAATRNLARELYDPNRPGLWSHPQFVPLRVGELVPIRLSDVLGERR